MYITCCEVGTLEGAHTYLLVAHNHKLLLTPNRGPAGPHNITVNISRIFKAIQSENILTTSY